MILRALILSGLLGASAAFAQSPVDMRDLARISNYLNATETLRGEFVQVDPDSVVAEGEFSMRRPGRIRFEYDPPNTALVVADGFWVAVIDRADGGVDRYPLNDTPLSLLLKEDVDLRREGWVRAIDRSDGQLAVTARDPEAPDQGDITLIFSENPLELRQWVVRDAQGRATTVALRDVRVNVPVEAAEFVIRDPER
jgi:outer membrane lipoprotein-sorting protein